jgi:predicted RNA-binding protein associated with RNAse of E/G family
MSTLVNDSSSKNSGKRKKIVIEHVDLDELNFIVDSERITEARAEQISEEIMEAVYKHYGMKFVPRKLQG